MFTGIVDHVGLLEKVEARPEGARAWIRSRFSELVPGESIAVDGVCLTVTEPAAAEPTTDGAWTRFAVDLSPETLRVTVAGLYRAERPVNLERALCLGDRLGGHLVTGHVDHTARVTTKAASGDCLELVFRGLPPTSRRLLFAKGSVTVQGVSLTVNETYRDGFGVMLVPHTCQRTTLSRLAVDDVVNVEHDWLAKLFLNAYAERNADEAMSGHH